MKWNLYVRRWDPVKNEWFRLGPYASFFDFTGQMTYAQVWRKLRPLAAEWHTSRIRLERALI